MRFLFLSKINALQNVWGRKRKHTKLRVKLIKRENAARKSHLLSLCHHHMHGTFELPYHAEIRVQDGVVVGEQLLQLLREVTEMLWVAVGNL